MFDVTEADLRRRTGTKWQHYGPDVLPAWVADMDYPIAPVIRAAIDAALDRGDIGYPPASAECAVAATYAERAARRWGWQFDPDRVELVADVMVGVRRCLMALCEPGDAVVVAEPVYPPFRAIVPDLHLRRVDNPVGPDGAFDLEALDRQLTETGSKVLLVCSPHNPLGRVYTASELVALVEVARRHDAWIIADEIHAELTWEPHVFTPLGMLAPERTITLTSASKAYNLAGLRCALVIPGTDALADRLATQTELDLHGVGSLAIGATLAAWSPEGDAWHAELRRYLTARRDQVASRLGEVLPHRLAQSTYLAWLDARHVSDDPYHHFLAGGVALSDGERFGAPGWVRLNFATSASVLEAICDRLLAASV